MTRSANRASSAVDLVKLTEVAEAATPGPWRYRPNPHDDWGWVRAADDATIASAFRGAWDGDKVIPAHRAAGTDPFGHNALHIATFDPPTVLRLIQRLREAHEALKPFAEVSSAYDAWLRQGSTTTPDMFNFAYGGVRITLQSYRAAQSALSTVAPPVGEEGGVMVSSDTQSDAQSAPVSDGLTPLERELLAALTDLVSEASRIAPQLPYNAPTADLAASIEVAQAAITKIEKLGGKWS